MKKILLSMLAFASVQSVSAQYWQQQNTGFPESSGVVSISVVDTNVTWATVRDGSGSGLTYKKYGKTTNGGAAWTVGDITAGTDNSGVTNIQGLSATTAIAGIFDVETGFGGIAKTTDGGATWTFEKEMNSNGSWVNFAHYFDTNNGIVGGDPVGNYFEVYTTSNGGTSWTRVPSANFPPPLSGEYGYNGAFYSVGDTLFFATNKGRIFRSLDKGLHWTVVLQNASIITDFGGASVSGDMAWKDNNTGIVVKNAASLSMYKTTNGGASWENVSFTGIPASTKIADITYVPSTSTLIAVSDAASGSGSWKSTDHGTTWTALDSGVQRLSVACLNASLCYSGTFAQANGVSGISKSTQPLAVSEVSGFTAEKRVSAARTGQKDVFKLMTSVPLVSYEVTDLSGKSVQKGKSVLLDLSGTPEGVYIVSVRTQDGNVHHVKVVK